MKTFTRVILFDNANIQIKGNTNIINLLFLKYCKNIIFKNNLINNNIYSPCLFYNQKNKIFGLNICDNNKIYIFYNNTKQILIIKNKNHNLVKKKLLYYK